MGGKALRTPSGWSGRWRLTVVAAILLVALPVSADRLATGAGAAGGPASVVVQPAAFQTDDPTATPEPPAPTPTREPPSPTPTPEPPPPTGTPLPEPTATPIPLAESTPTSSLDPTATPDSTVTPDAPAPTATEEPPQPGVSAAEFVAAESGATALSAADGQRANPGATVAFRHVVTHLGREPDHKNVTAVSSRGWPVALFEADGATPLSDRNGDGLADVGALASGESAIVVVAVAVPADALAEVVDETTLTARSATDPADVAQVVDQTAVNRVLSLSVETPDVAFGQVSADGTLDPAATGTSSQTDGHGAFYVKEGAIRVTVVSNAPWTGACFAAENAGSAATVRVADGRLAWRQTGAAGWTAFALGQPFPSAGACLPGGGAGTTILVYDLRLRVEWSDAPGTVQTTVSFVASP